MDKQQIKFVSPEEATLSDIIDRLLNKGVVIAGDLVLSVADVPLIYCELRVLLTSVEKYEQIKQRIYDDSSPPQAS